MAARRILPRFIVPGGRRLDLALMDLSARNPAAITNWVQGEREYRRASFALALDLLQRAVALDSNLGVAAVRGAQAAMWAERPNDARILVDHALARKEVLLPKHVQLAMGIRSYLAGDADSATHQLRRAVAADTSWSEALMALGEVYYHLLPSEHPLDSLAEANFRRAVRSDSTFTPPLFHLAEIELRAGDVAAAQRTLARVSAVSSDTAHLAILRLSLNCVQSLPRKSDWTKAAAGEVGLLLAAGRVLEATPRYSSCAEEAYRAVLVSPSAKPGARFVATFGLHALLAAGGRSADARTVIGDAMSRGIEEARAFHLLAVFSGLTPVDSLAELTMRSLAGDFTKMNAPQLWYHGTWHAMRGQRDSLALVARALQELATRSGVPRDRVIADAIGARAALATGDTARAVSLLQGLRITVPREGLAFGFWEPLAGERMLLARLHVAQGRRSEARAIARDLGHAEPIAFLYFRPERLHILQ
jgi:tetratricopeptide (TPR) repeat protein